MTVTSAVPDREAKTLTLTADYAAPVAAVWQLWADPRLLERWWGPPTYPATVKEHDLRAGGRVTYLMTGPDGDQHHGWWRVLDVDGPTSLRFDDGFGEPFDETMPVSQAQVTLTGTGSGTQMVVRTSFGSTEALDQLLEMGMLEGLREAVGQTDALLLEVAQR